MLKKMTLALSAASLCAVASLSTPVLADENFITIGTGGVTGVYYPTGGAICRLVNRNIKKHGIKCSVEATGGSVYNLNTIRAGELDMGVAQSDWQYHAYHGTSKFTDQGANSELRAVFSVHPEPFTVVARADSEISSFADLKGKRVNIGNPGSGQRGTMEVVMEALGWSKDDFKLASELKSAEQSKALCDNKVDAIIFTVGHPSGSIKEASTSCDSVLVSVEGPEIDALVEANSYYRHATIPGGTYRGTPDDVRTFGVGATFVSSTNTPENTVYQVVKSVFDNFKTFRKLHPAFSHLEKADMATSGLSAPLHDGAKKYYMESGIL